MLIVDALSDATLDHAMSEPIKTDLRVRLTEPTIPGAGTSGPASDLLVNMSVLGVPNLPAVVAFIHSKRTGSRVFSWHCSKLSGTTANARRQSMFSQASKECSTTFLECCRAGHSSPLAFSGREFYDAHQH